LPGASFGYEYEEFINYFPGTLSNFRLINHALTDAERTRLYTENVYLPLPQPVACFNGVSSLITFNNPITDKFNISFDIRFNTVTRTQGILFQNSNNSLGIRIDPSGYIIIYVSFDGLTTTDICTSTENLSTGIKYTFNFSFDGTKYEFKINNIVQSFYNTTQQCVQSPIFRLGCWNWDDPNLFFSGTISNFRIFNVALTDSEITRLFKENVYLPVFKQKWIEDIDVIDDFLEEEKDRVVFAVIRQRGQDPMSPYEGIQWSESMMSEIPVPLLMQQIMDAAVKESQYVNVNFETIMVGGHEQLSIRFNTVGIDRLYKEIQNV